MKKEFEFLNEVEMDFSKYEEASLSEMERVRMKQNLKKNSRNFQFRKNMTRAAACAAVLLAFSQTTFAKDIMEKIVSIGHSSVVIEEEQNPDMDYIYPIPEELIGQVFDENGNELSEVTGETAKISAASCALSSSKPYLFNTRSNSATISLYETLILIFSLMLLTQSTKTAARSAKPGGNLCQTIYQTHRLPAALYFLFILTREIRSVKIF